MLSPGGGMEEARRLAAVLQALEERLAATVTLEELEGVLTELIQGLREALPSLLASMPQDNGREAWRTIGGRPYGLPQGGPREGESPWTLDRPYGHLFGGGSEPKGR
ncbi:MAG: hypothetical protein ACXU86_11470 [Archangium sp.]